ncbi:MAG: hypothetical protein FJ278_22695, partial [Planctomycetes bacterium]|nr:hypothetical protein [Planctomycetota bacterium]
MPEMRHRISRPQAAFIALLLVLLPYLGARPLFIRWQIDGHDARYDAIRLAQLDKCVRDGQFSARWLPDLANGYGCPLFNFYSPFLYQVAEAFHLSGLSLVSSIKAVYALGFLASSLAMFLFGRELWGPFGGLLSAALYVLVPYRFVDIYVRSAFLEFFALSYPPLIFWAALRYAKTRRVRYLLAATLSHALLILTHAISAMLFTPLILLYYLLLSVLYRRRSPVTCHLSPSFRLPPSAHTPIRPHAHTLIPLLASFALSLALTAFFWLPALAEKRYIHSDEMTRGVLDYAHHFVAPWQLFSTRWGFGLSVAGSQDAMSFQIGPLHL